MSAVATKPRKANPFAAFAKAKPKNKEDHVTLNMPELEAKAKSFLAKKQEAKDLATLADMEGDQLKEKASQLFLEECRRSKKADSCIHLQCGSVKLTYIVQYKYSPIPLTRPEPNEDGTQDDAAIEAELKRAFGPDYDRYFQEKNQVEMKKEATEDDELRQEILEKLGPDLFAKAFNVFSSLSVTEALHDEMQIDPVTRAQAEPFVSLLVIKPTAPSIRLA